MKMLSLGQISDRFESTLKVDAGYTEDVATTTLTKEQRQLATDTLTNMRRLILSMIEKHTSAEMDQSLQTLNEDVGKVFSVFIVKKSI